MSLGQAYIGSLLNDVDDNLVRTVAAYNGGRAGRPALMRWDNALNASADPLLYIATIPLNETRDFVHRVMANYWMYRIRPANRRRRSTRSRRMNRATCVRTWPANEHRAAALHR